jgi:predicted  nucleic acid-binding Zn-ribbon protein
MKRLSQALCTRCGRVWSAAKKLVLDGQSFCPGGCGIPGIVRINTLVDWRR